MTLEIRRSTQRGQADHGWLQSQHTFSFAGYMDPRFMGFGPLRVINQDVVQPGRGFGTHPHRNMEIISVVLKGALEHKDTIGTGSVIRPGEVQLMSAGAGIAHSEFNHSDQELVEFLQIWILPREGGGQPGYQQHDFGTEPGVKLVVSADGRDGSLTAKQDFDLWRARLQAGDTHVHSLAHRRAWIQVIEGPAVVNGALLQPGDGLAVTETPALEISADNDADLLLFDLP